MTESTFFMPFSLARVDCWFNPAGHTLRGRNSRIAALSAIVRGPTE
jgi:hypothetical protein